MTTLKSLIVKHLRRHDIDYHCESAGDDEDRIIAHYSGKNTGMVCGIELHEKPRRLCITVGNGLKASPERMSAAYELIARMSTGLAIGTFWINPADGEIVFAVNGSMIGIEPTDTWIGSTICTALKTYDAHCPVIANVLFAGADPVEALTKLGGPTDEEVNDTLQKLFFSDGDDESPEADTETLFAAEGSDEAVSDSAGADNSPSNKADGTAKTPLDLWSPRIPRLIAKVAPEDIAEIQREIEGKDDQPDSKEADAGE